MSLIVTIMIFGLADILAGERLFASNDAVRWGLDLVGVAGLAISGWLRFKRLAQAENPGVRAAHKIALALQVAVVSSLLLYVVSTDAFTGMLGMEGEFAHRWSGVFGVVWPIVLLVSLLGLFSVDRALVASPIAMPLPKATRALNNGLIAGLAIALVFPLNYLASRHDKEWDFSYFRTAQAGTAVKAMLDGMEGTVYVRIFQPSSSEVTPELRQYFRDLEGSNLVVEVVDQAADPQLARYLRVRDNGYIAFTVGEVDLDNADPASRPPTQVVNVGATLRKARPKLKKLDEEVGKAMLALSRGELTAYVTAGHGEFTWDKEEAPQRSLQGFKQLLEQRNFRIKKLGLTEGLGDAIPDDADVLFILGPSKPFLPAEVDALTRYLDAGGAAVFALEPVLPGSSQFNRDGLDPILSKLGVKRGDGVLASTQQIVALTRGKMDRLNVTTDQFSTHPSTAVLAGSPERVFVSTSGHLEALDGGGGKATPTIRTGAKSWADLDGDLEFDDGKEVRKARIIAMASSGPADANWRSLVIGDATLFSDMAIIVAGNQQALADGAAWLTRTEAFTGTTETEEDIKIQHTQEGQTGWFYLTVLGFPLLILGFGMIRTRRRGRRA